MRVLRGKWAHSPFWPTVSINDRFAQVSEKARSCAYRAILDKSCGDAINGVRVLAALRQLFAQCGAQILRHVSPHGPVAAGGEPGDHLVQHAVAEFKCGGPVLRVQPSMQFRRLWHSHADATKSGASQPRRRDAELKKIKVFCFFLSKKKSFLTFWTGMSPTIPDKLAVPVAATAVCFAIILAGGLLAQLVPPDWAGNWHAHVVRMQAHFIDRFFPFDAVWYQRIATDFYVWDPSQPVLKQDVAFFPLWPIVLRLIGSVVVQPQAARWVTVGAAAACGFGSIWAFHRLARRALPRRSAVIATWLFALWPGASFLLLSYPTGLMNLLVVLALLATLQRRYWAAAVCAGLVTAIGPLGLGTAMAVWACAALDRWAGLRSAAERSVAAYARVSVFLGGLGMVATSGLFGFLLWQYVKFGDAFAFIKAQGAWAAPLPWLARIPRAILQLLIVPDFGLGFAYAVHALHARTLVALQAELEKGVHHVALGLALLMLVVCLRAAPRPVVLQGVFTLALFIWFHSTSRPGNSALRLTYCVMAIFLGLGWVLRGRPKLAGWVIGISAAMLGCGAFLSAAGYHVV